VQLLRDLHTSSALQRAFLRDRSGAIATYELTAHERGAVVTLDLDDFVALGVVSLISQLPPVMLGSGGHPPGWWPGWLRRMIDRFRQRDAPPIDPRPPPPGPLPPPGPGPGPLPGPGPGRGPRPGPGPDPPPGD
jgi:hypothetical protein